MVGVPVLLVVCDSVPVPPVWVMAVGEGCSGWCCFQWWVAVVFASRRVPGVGVCVSWLVPDVSGACVGWLVLVGVAGAGVGVFWLVCVFWWFRMLMCSCLFLFPGFAFLSCIVWLITGCLGFWCVGWVLGCLFSCADRPTVFVFGVLSVGSGGCCWPVWLFGDFGWWLARVCFVCAFLGGWCVRVPWWLVLLLGGVGGVPRWVVGLLFFVCWLVRVCESVWGVWLRVSGERGCLGGGLPVWLGDVVASGGASVGFDVGGCVFTFGGVSVPGSGSSPDVLVSGEAGSCSVSGSGVSSVVAVSSGSSSSGVRVCVPCAVRVFGDSWCSLVLRRWVRAAGVDGAKVDTLLGSGPGSGSVRSVASGGAASSRVGAVSSGLVSSSPSPVSGGSASLRSASAGGGRVGVGFGARVCDWGARVGVGVGVVSGGGVVARLWAGVVGRVRALVSGVGAWGLVLAGLVGVVVLVSVLVLVG